MKNFGVNQRRQHCQRWLKASLSAALLVALTSVGCGRASDPPAVGGLPGASVGCPAGQFAIGGFPCMQAADFASACSARFGVLTNVNGAQVCRTYTENYIFYSGTNTPFSVLNANAPQGGVNTGLALKKGDRLYFSAQGSYGYAETDRSVKCVLWGYLCGSVTWITNNCSEVPVSGSGVDPYLGQPAGYFGSDGTETFFLGSGLTKTINNAGTLRVGFNVPTANGLCARASMTFGLARCEDAAGNSYPCQ